MNYFLRGAISAGAVLAFAGAATAQSTFTQPNMTYGNTYGAPAAPYAGTPYNGAIYGAPNQAYPGTAYPQGTSAYTFPTAAYTQQPAAPHAPAAGYTQQASTYGQTGVATQPSTSTTGYAQPAATYNAQPVTDYNQPATTYAQPGAATYGLPPMAPYGATAPAYGQPATTYPLPGTYTPPATTYAPSATAFPQPASPYPPLQQATFGTFPQPQPYFPTGTAPQGGQQAQPAATTVPTMPDTDAWAFAFARYYPAIRACLRSAKAENPVIANIHERPEATEMLIGKGGTADYQVCSTGLKGTTIREGQETRPLPPAFYAPMGTSFTVSPERPFQPVVDTTNRLVGWIVRTTPVRLDLTGGRGFDGQFIRPITVNPDAG